MGAYNYYDKYGQIWKLQAYKHIYREVWPYNALGAYRKWHALSVTEVALTDHQIKSMVTSDRW